MPFKYRLQKVVEFRIRKKEEQLQAVMKAQAEVQRIEGLIAQNNQTILQTKKDMRTADPMMYETYDNFLHHLYEVGEKLEKEKQEALEKLEEEKKLLVEREKDVKILEKHKEKMKDIYLAEEKAAELKRLSEVGIQKYFRTTQEKIEDEQKEGQKNNEN